MFNGYIFVLNLLFIYWPGVEPDLKRQTNDCQVSPTIARPRKTMSLVWNDDSGFFD